MAPPTVRPLDSLAAKFPKFPAAFAGPLCLCHHRIKPEVIRILPGRGSAGVQHIDGLASKTWPRVTVARFSPTAPIRLFRLHRSPRRELWEPFGWAPFGSSKQRTLFVLFPGSQRWSKYGSDTTGSSRAAPSTVAFKVCSEL